jgi:hypothetical protein
MPHRAERGGSNHITAALAEARARDRDPQVELPAQGIREKRWPMHRNVATEHLAACLDRTCRPDGPVREPHPGEGSNRHYSDVCRSCRGCVARWFVLGEQFGTSARGYTSVSRTSARVARVALVLLISR